MLYTADGSWVQRGQVVLTKDDVLAFVDGRVFLRDLDRVAGLGVHPRCTRCGAEPTAAVCADRAAVRVACACRAGEVATVRPLELEPLLLALGWRLECPRCDGALQGNNDPHDPVFHVACSCTDRIYARAVA